MKCDVVCDSISVDDVLKSDSISFEITKFNSLKDFNQTVDRS